jgi:hypothetical protein
MRDSAAALSFHRRFSARLRPFSAIADRLGSSFNSLSIAPRMPSMSSNSQMIASEPETSSAPRPVGVVTTATPAAIASATANPYPSYWDGKKKTLARATAAARAGAAIGGWTCTLCRTAASKLFTAVSRLAEAPKMSNSTPGLSRRTWFITREMTRTPLRAVHEPMKQTRSCLSRTACSPRSRNVSSGAGATTAVIEGSYKR